MGLIFEGEAVAVKDNAYEAGEYNGRAFEAGVSTSISVLNEGDSLRLKVAKGVDPVSMEALREALDGGMRVRVRLDLEYAFNKLQVVRIAEAA